MGFTTYYIYSRGLAGLPPNGFQKNILLRDSKGLLLHSNIYYQVYAPVFGIRCEWATVFYLNSNACPLKTVKTCLLRLRCFSPAYIHVRRPRARSKYNSPFSYDYFSDKQQFEKKTLFISTLFQVV